jgi:hypothetical protein
MLKAQRAEHIDTAAAEKAAADAAKAATIDKKKTDLPDLAKKGKQVALEALDASSVESFKAFEKNKNDIEQKQLDAMYAIKDAIEDQETADLEEA